jgi:hypothetical protein
VSIYEIHILSLVAAFDFMAKQLLASDQAGFKFASEKTDKITRDSNGLVASLIANELTVSQMQAIMPSMSRFWASQHRTQQGKAFIDIKGMLGHGHWLKVSNAGRRRALATPEAAVAAALARAAIVSTEGVTAVITKGCARFAFCAVLTREPPTSASMSGDTMVATAEARTPGAARPLSRCRSRRPRSHHRRSPPPERRGSSCLPSL